MTPIQQVAIEFCRECLRLEDVWEDVEWGGILHVPKRVIRSSDRNVYFDCLHDVMNEVRNWCDRTGCRIELQYSPDQSGFGVLCEGIDTWDENPCRALMSACVEAARKLKAA